MANAKLDEVNKKKIKIHLTSQQQQSLTLKQYYCPLQLSKDLEELKQFSEKSLRKRVQGILGIEIRRIETEIIQIRDQIASTSQTDVAGVSSAVQPKPTPNQTKRYEVELTNYGWDQSDKFIKLFVTLDGVHGASEDDVLAIFNPSSIVLQIKGVNNKDFKLNINNLLEPIDVEKSYRKVKTNMVTIYAKKVKEGSYHHHHHHSFIKTISPIFV